MTSTIQNCKSMHLQLKKMINATSLVFTPNISWSLFSGAMYNEPVNIPISIFVLIISLVCFYLTFDYKSDDE